MAAARIRHRERRRSDANHRHAVLSGRVGRHSIAEWLDLVQFYGGRCFYCGAVPKVLTRDHEIPVSRGGDDSIWNILPACQSCNSRKHTRTAEEFLALRGEVHWTPARLQKMLLAS